jgi:hypothetical protein
MRSGSPLAGSAANTAEQTIPAAIRRTDIVNRFKLLSGKRQFIKVRLIFQ